VKAWCLICLQSCQEMCPIMFILTIFLRLQLLHHLSESNIHATGVIRSNRLGNCPLQSAKTLEKQERGFFSQQTGVSNAVTIVGWNDNHAVVSNAFGSRYCRKTKTRINVSLPFLIRQYNKGMGGVDRCNQNVSTYRILNRIRKWWWALF